MQTFCFVRAFFIPEKNSKIFQKRSLNHISKCCLRSLYDEYGNVYIVVDMELKGRIREALIKMILGFDIEDMDLEPEE